MSIGLPLALGGVGINGDLPAAVSYLNLTNQVANGKAQVEITWGNPASNFGGVAIVRKEGSAPTHFTDGVRVYDGIGTSCLDPDVEVGKTYFYRAFPYNRRRQVQTLGTVPSIVPTVVKRLSAMPVGSLLKIKENGVPVNYLVVHQGKPSSIYDASCDGTWLLRRDITENRVWNTNSVNKLESSNIHAYLNGTWLNRYDANIKNAIKQVKIPYRQNGGSGGTDKNGVNGLSCKIFLLSGYEVGWTTSTSPYFPVDGAKLAYFISGNDSAAQQKREVKLNGSPGTWWLRSPKTDSTTSAWYVLSDGDYNNGHATNSEGVRPTLILPEDFLVEATPNDDNSYSPINQ